VRARDFERWLICNTGQIAALPDHSVASLREQARSYADGAARVGQAWFAQWLDRADAMANDIKREVQES